jgi:hypothetical protein
MTEATAVFLRSYLTRLPADHPHRRARVTAFAFGDSPALAKKLPLVVCERPMSASDSRRIPR